MQTYLYLSVMPETLVASMLPPSEFGTYLAVGSQQKLPHETMFFSLKSDFLNDAFDFSKIEKSCVPHKDGRAKKSLYLSIYRVLENIPLNAVDKLHLVTRDGRVLELASAALPETTKDECYLYAEICPTSPLVISTLQPVDYGSFITAPRHALHIPKIFFMDMVVPDLTEGQPLGSINSIKDHVIETHKSLLQGGKKTKIVDRRHQIKGFGKGVKTGFYLGDKDGMLFFPFPTLEELRKVNYEWYRSANL